MIAALTLTFLGLALSRPVSAKSKRDQFDELAKNYAYNEDNPKVYLVLSRRQKFGLNTRSQKADWERMVIPAGAPVAVENFAGTDRNPDRSQCWVRYTSEHGSSLTFKIESKDLCILVTGVEYWESAEQYQKNLSKLFGGKRFKIRNDIDDGGFTFPYDNSDYTKDSTIVTDDTLETFNEERFTLYDGKDHRYGIETTKRWEAKSRSGDVRDITIEEGEYVKLLTAEKYSDGQPTGMVWVSVHDDSHWDHVDNYFRFQATVIAKIPVSILKVEVVSPMQMDGYEEETIRDGIRDELSTAGINIGKIYFLSDDDVIDEDTSSGWVWKLALAAVGGVTFNYFFPDVVKDFTETVSDLWDTTDGDDFDYGDDQWDWQETSNLGAQ